MLFNPIKTLCERKLLRGNWMSHSICCPHATAMLIYTKWISLPSSFTAAHMWLYIWAFNLPRPRRERLFLHWVMLFIKLYRNPVACLSGQSISSSSIMISATPACCYLVMLISQHVFFSCSRSHGDSSFQKQKTLISESSSATGESQSTDCCANEDCRLALCLSTCIMDNGQTFNMGVSTFNLVHVVRECRSTHHTGMTLMTSIYFLEFLQTLCFASPSQPAHISGSSAGAWWWHIERCS